MRQRLQIMLSLLLLGCICACSDGGSSKKEEEPSVIDRTVLIYVMGDNSLNSSVSINWEQIKEGAAAATTMGNLLVYVDQYAKPPILYKVLSDGTTQIVKTYQEQNSASLTVLSAVLNDVFDRYPAKEKGLVLWSHGEGWAYSASTGSGALRSMAESVDLREADGHYIQTKWIGQDLETPEGGAYYLNIADIKHSLRATGTHLDFILFDACFMSSVEVAYELRREVDNYIASPSEVMGNNSYYRDHTGFPYKQLVPMIFKEQINYKAIALSFYDYYNDLPVYGGYSDQMRSAAIAWVVTEKLDSLADYTCELLQKNSFPVSVDYVNMSGVQTYDRSSQRAYHLYYDLEHAMSRIVADEGKEALNKWRALLGRCVQAEYHTKAVFGHELFSVCGLSVYVPQRISIEHADKYDELEWYEDAGWKLLPGWGIGK